MSIGRFAGIRRFEGTVPIARVSRRPVAGGRPATGVARHAGFTVVSLATRRRLYAAATK